jgi:hypothetical protein
MSAQRVSDALGFAGNALTTGTGGASRPDALGGSTGFVGVGAWDDFELTDFGVTAAGMLEMACEAAPT